MFLIIMASLAAVVAIVVLAGQAGLFQSSPPAELGVRDGRLAAPKSTPNNVHSQADAFGAGFAHTRIDALPLRGDGAASIARVKAVLETRPRTRIVESRGDYLRVEFTTKWMKFVDDAEFWFDPAAQAIQVRSASRVGHGDHGVNRQRIESVRERYLAAP